MGTLAAALRDRVNSPVDDDLDYIKEADELMLAAAEMLEDAEKALADTLEVATRNEESDFADRARAILTKLREPR